MAQQQDSPGLAPLYGDVVRGVLGARSVAYDDSATEQERAKAREALDFGMGVLSGYAQYNLDLRDSAQQVMAAIAMEDRVAELDAMKPEDFADENYLTGAGEITASQARDEREAAMGVIGSVPRITTEYFDSFSDQLLGGRRVPISSVTDDPDDPEGYYLPIALQQRPLWESGSEARETLRFLQVDSSPVVERDGKRYVQTEDFGELELPEINFAAKAADRGLLGELIFAPRSVESGDVTGDWFYPRTDREKKHGYDSLVGRWNFLPKMTGNRVTDEALLQDPLFLRGLKESDVGRMILPGARALAGTLDYIALEAATRGAGKVLGKGLRAAAKASSTRFPAKIFQAGKQAVFEGGKPGGRPKLWGDVSPSAGQVVMEGYYGGVNAWAHNGDVLQGIHEGFGEGMLELGISFPVRGVRRGVMARAMALADKGRGPKWMRRWVAAAEKPREAAAGAGVEAGLAAMQDEAFSGFVGRFRKQVDSAIGRQFKRQIMRQGFSDLWDTWFVGMGFGAFGAAQLYAERDGKNWSALGKDEKLGYWVRGLGSPEALAQAMAYSSIVVGNHAAFQAASFTPEQGDLIADLSEASIAMVQLITPDESAGYLRATQRLVNEEGLQGVFKKAQELFGEDRHIDRKLPDWERTGAAEFAETIELPDGYEKIRELVIPEVSDETLARLDTEVRSLPLTRDADPRAIGPVQFTPSVVQLRQLIRDEVQARRADKSRRKPAQVEVSTEGERKASLETLGFNAEAHALRAVKRHLGKDYKTLAEVPLGELEKAAALSGTARKNRQTRAASESPQELVQKAEAATAAQREFVWERRRERDEEALGKEIKPETYPSRVEVLSAQIRIYDALRMHPDYAGKTFAELTEQHLPLEERVTQLGLEEAVARAEEQAEAVPPPTSSPKVVDTAPPGSHALDVAAELAREGNREAAEALAQGAIEEQVEPERWVEKGRGTLLQRARLGMEGLVPFLQTVGGLKPGEGGDVQQVGESAAGVVKRTPGFSRLVQPKVKPGKGLSAKKQKGLEISDAIMAAWEAGFYPGLDPRDIYRGDFLEDVQANKMHPELGLERALFEAEQQNTGRISFADILSGLGEKTFAGEDPVAADVPEGGFPWEGDPEELPDPEPYNLDIPDEHMLAFQMGATLGRSQGGSSVKNFQMALGIVFQARKPGRTADMHAFVAGALASGGVLDETVEGILTGLGLGATVERVRGELIEAGMPKIQPLLPRLAELKDSKGKTLLSRTQLKDEKLRADLAAAALAPPVRGFYKGGNTHLSAETVLRALERSQEASAQRLQALGIGSEDVVEFKAMLEVLKPNLEAVARDRGSRATWRDPIQRLARKIAQRLRGNPDKVSTVIPEIQRSAIEMARDIFDLAAGKDLAYEPSATFEETEWELTWAVGEEYSKKALEGLSKVERADGQPLFREGLGFDSRMRFLHMLAQGDGAVRRMFHHTMGEAEGDAKFEELAELAKTGRAVTHDAVLALSLEVGGDVELQKTKDILEALDIHGRDEIIEGPLADRLVEYGLMDVDVEQLPDGSRREFPSGEMHRGIHLMLAQRYRDMAVEAQRRKDVKPEDYVEGALMLHSMNPLALLAGPFMLDPKVGEKSWWNRSPSIEGKSWIEKLAKGREDSRLVRTVNKLAARIYNYSPTTRPGRSQFAPQSVRKQQIAFRRKLVAADAQTEATRVAVQEIVNYLDRSNLPKEVRELMSVAIEAGMFYRAKGPEDYAKLLGVTEGMAQKVKEGVEAIVNLTNATLQRHVDLGIITPRQAAAGKSRYVAHIRKEIQAGRNNLDRQRWGGAGREMSRDPDNAMPLAQRMLDPAHWMPAAMNMESRRAELYTVLYGLVSPDSSVSAAEYAEMPEGMQAFYEKAMLPPEQPGSWERQNLLHRYIDEQEKSMRSGKTPTTARKEKLFSDLNSRYVLKMANEEVAILLRAFEPQTHNKLLDALSHAVHYWRRVKTLENPKHWHLNFRSIITGNTMLGRTSLADFVSSVFFGRGHAADAARHLATFQEWAEGTGEFDGAGPRSELALDDPRRSIVSKVERFMQRAGMQTFAQTILEPVSVRNQLESWMGKMGEMPTGEAGYDAELGLAHGIGAMGDAKASLDARIGALLQGQDASAKAQGMRAWIGQYNMIEAWGKYWAFLSLEANNAAGASFDQLVEFSMEATADYADRNPYLYRFSSDFLYTSGEITKEIRRARREAGRPDLSGPMTFARVLLSQPFLAYMHSTTPAFAHALAFNTPRAIAYAALFSFAHMAMSKMLSDEDEARDSVLNPLAGTSEWFEADFVLPEPMWVELKSRYGDVPINGFTGQDMTGLMGGNLVKDWVDQSVLGVMDPGFFISRAPDRGGRSRYMTWFEDLRPFSWMPYWGNSVRYLTSSHVPFQWNSPMDDVHGLLPQTSIGAFMRLSEGFMGKKGRGSAEVWGGIMRDTAQEMFGAPGLADEVGDGGLGDHTPWFRVAVEL